MSDRLAIAFSCHGARLRILADDPSALEQAFGRLPPGAVLVELAEVDASFTLAGGEDLDAALDRLESEMHFAVALHARDRIFVHAGVVGWRGRSILLPGRSLSGKSTLVAALVRAGATYLSDEYAILDERGLVHAYPKRLSLRGDPARRDLAPREAELDTTSLPVGLVAVTRHAEGTQWIAQPLSTGQAVLALLDNTVVAQLRPELALSTVTRAVGDAVAIEAVRGEADEASAELLEIVDRAQPTTTHSTMHLREPPHG